MLLVKYGISRVMQLTNNYCIIIITKILQKIGLIDSYRTAHPNPITHPGITWDWRDKIDEHRIDYIFYKSPILQVIDSKTYKAFFNEEFILNNKSFIFPSDHGIVVTTFKINK